jgi:hypothetical protein
MKNFKVIVSLVALIAVSNASAVQTVLQKKLTAAVDKIAKNPSVELSADEKALLSKHINSNDASIKRLKGIQGFDMSQLGATSSPDVYVAPDITTLPAPMNATTAPAKPLTAAQKRAAARAEAAAAKTAPVKTAPVQKATPGKPLTASQRAAAKREAAAAAKAEAAAAQTQAAKGKNPFAEKVGQVNPYAQTNNLSPIPFVGSDYYQQRTGLLTEPGIEELVKLVSAKYPSLNRVRIISTAYDYAVEALKGPRFMAGRSENLAKNESDQLMARINKIVLDTERKSASAPRLLPATPKPANLPAPQWTAEQIQQKERDELSQYTRGILAEELEPVEPGERLFQSTYELTPKEREALSTPL